MDALRPLTVGELLDAALRIYRERFKTLVFAVAIPMVPVVVFQTLVDWSVGADADPLQAPDTAETVSAGEAALQVGGTLVGTFALVVATALATAACFRALSAAYVGGEVTWRESLAFARTRMWSVIGLSLLVGLGTGLGFLACIVPGVILLVRWSVATPAMLMEGLGVGDSLRRSSALAKLRFWPVLGAVLLSTLVATVFQVAVSAPFFGLLFTDVDGFLVHLVEAAVTLVGLVLVTPFTAAFTMALYVDLRVRFEGFDLYLWSQHGGAVPPGHPGPQVHGFAAPGPGMGPAGTSVPPPGTVSLPPPPPPPTSGGFGPPSTLAPPPSPPDGPPPTQ